MTAKPAADTFSDVRQWMHAHPYAVDALIALGALAAILLGAAARASGHEVSPGFGRRDVHPQTALLAALACAVLVLRRRAPMPVLCITALVTVVGLVVDPRAGAPSEGHRAPIVIAAIIALYTVSNRTDRVTSVRVGVVTVGVLTAAGMLLGSRPWYAQDNLATFAWTGLAAAAGEAVRSRRAFVDAIRERAERAERTREEEARRRVAEERMRIARELHDVVAHHIALVNVQAGVASHVMDRRPDQAKEALAHVREASRHALNELQATVGLLRQSGESPAPTEPAPGLGVLDELVEGFTRAGLSVAVDVATRGETAAEGEGGEAPRALPSAVDLTAYRVVQEALTNVQKHVGAGAHARVRIVTLPGDLEITVTDDGEPGGAAALGSADGARAGRARTDRAADTAPAAVPAQERKAPEPAAAPAPSAATGGGHGLVGMRERAAALHGVCETGPLPEGGFRVFVRLPLRPCDRAGDGPGAGAAAGAAAEGGAGPWAADGATQRDADRDADRDPDDGPEPRAEEGAPA